jgi:6-pyruvoyltetrahydropterin/6-carboxytetrahydropterin synthase
MAKWTVKKRMEIAAAHSLPHLTYPSKCTRTHGHNWIVTVTCEASALDPDTHMITDFTHIKEAVNELDHQLLNSFIEYPTAERIAEWVCHKIPCCTKVEVQESEGNIAIYEA